MLRIVIAAGTVAATIYYLFVRDTDNAKKEYRAEKIKYISETGELRAKIAQVKREISSLYDPFKAIHSLYVESIQCADNAYLAKTKISSVIKEAYISIDVVKKKMSVMYESSKMCRSQQEKDNVHSELAELKKLKNILYEEQKKSIEERKKFMSMVLDFNSETRALKEYIRDNCGYGGRVWYERKTTQIAPPKC